MAFGDTLRDTSRDVMFDKLNPWIKNPPDFDDVTQAYKNRGKLQAKRVRVLGQIESIESSIIAESDKPRSNETRIHKLVATKKLRNELIELDAEIAMNENEVKLLEFRRAMFSAANYQLKNTMDL